MIRFGMHLSLWAAAWTKESAAVAVPEAARHGLDLIEIPLLTPETVDVEHARAILLDHGVAATASLCLPADRMAADDPAAAERYLTGALDVAHGIGCSILGGVTYSSLGYRSGKPPTEAEYANIAKALKPVARLAGERGMLIGIEPCNRYETHLLNTATQGVALIERIGEPNVTIHLDTYHMNIEEKGHRTGFTTAGRHTRYVHLSESDRGVPGTGTIDWTACFAGLEDIAFDGDLVMESFVTLPPEIAAALCVWRPVARDRHEVLENGIPFLKGLAKEHGLIG